MNPVEENFSNLHEIKCSIFRFCGTLEIAYLLTNKFYAWAVNPAAIHADILFDTCLCLQFFCFMCYIHKIKRFLVCSFCYIYVCVSVYIFWLVSVLEYLHNFFWDNILLWSWYPKRHVCVVLFFCIEEHIFMQLLWLFISVSNSWVCSSLFLRHIVVIIQTTMLSLFSMIIMI